MLPDTHRTRKEISGEGCGIACVELADDAGGWIREFKAHSIEDLRRRPGLIVD